MRDGAGFRARGGGSNKTGLDWSAISAEQLSSASPWRTFRWYKGQWHFPDFLLMTGTGPVVVDVKPWQHPGREKPASS